MDLQKACTRFVILSIVLLPALLLIHEKRRSTNVTCIHVTQPETPPKTLGGLYRASQLAFFLSSQLSAKLSVGSHSVFSRCPQADTSCRLDEDALILPRCIPGDCKCHARKIAPYLKQVSHCGTVQLKLDKRSTSEFSGCTREAVTRYVAPQNGSYNVLVYSGTGVDELSPEHAQYMQRQLCRLSDKDIVVIADEVKEVPICRNRTLLATGLDDKTMVSLIAGAENVGAMGGENVHMGVAGMKGGRLILPAEEIAVLDWAPVDDFTVIGARGTVFHFNSADMMRHAVSGGPPGFALKKVWSLRMEGDVRADPTVFYWEIPERTWG